ncbi:nucleoside hydrolase [Salipiger sp. PrR002]|uniref:nucleoside hydrolase n=1 Tax=Salipiger sp. PrR002 TaxID=2706489 RepID=UPI0013BC8F7B|nr:nucleoside hydrolase [Salipiger sp. PrR002]NDW02002.1 nucleoside hydrolase [Salipiger sp. PrR002]NDW59042.1 nucleoside hydrolase [Salipiger sp. PrR004]
MAEPRPILLDCDPGVDDALAILWIAAHPERFDLRAVTVVAGNVGLECTAPNARRMLDVAGLGAVPVYAGAHRPIMRARGKTSKMHGGDGLGDVGLPPATRAPEPLHGAQAIVETARACDGRLHLLATGPLTNLALALLLAPDLPELIDGITLMGGAAFGPGNTTPAAEFNFHVDPEAARIVFESGIPIVMAGLDVTRQAVLSPQAMARLSGPDAPLQGLCGSLLAGYHDPCLHDPAVVAYLLEPALFESVAGHVAIVTTPGDTAGQSVAAISERHLAGRAPNAQILTGLDQPRFEALFLNSMVTLGTSL